MLKGNGGERRGGRPVSPADRPRPSMTAGGRAETWQNGRSETLVFRDEDKNLKGPAASKRGKPTSRIFETSSTGLVPTRVFSRNAEGGRACATPWHGQWVHAELPQRSGDRVCSREAKFREGECPREDEPQESQGRRTWRNPAAVRPNRRRAQAPEARPPRRLCLQR
jgi:hypothetical protein